MQRQGTIVRCDPERGFGFVRCPRSPADVFIHVKDVERRGGMPTVGLAVDFEKIHAVGKGPRAMAVRPPGMAEHRAPARCPARVPAPGRMLTPGPPGATRGPTASLPLFLLALLLELSLLGWCMAPQRLPLIKPALALVMIAATLWLYGHDKHSALQRSWRVREDSLHLLALAGGWPAAWWARQLLCHKSRKPAFRLADTATVRGHLGLLAAFSAWPWVG